VARFCGTLLWSEARAGGVSVWPAMTALLGEGAIDRSGGLREGARLATWSPARLPGKGTDFASATGVAVAFAGYLAELPPGVRP